MLYEDRVFLSISKNQFSQFIINSAHICYDNQYVGSHKNLQEVRTRLLMHLNEAVMADGLPDPAPPAPTDPRLPLDARQVFKLKKSWKGIKRCMEATGVEMFIRMFKANGNVRPLFTRFQHLKTDDELRVDETLEKHATIVMEKLDETIDNVENVDYIKERLATVGKSHLSVHKDFTPEYFWKIEQPFLDALKITLGDRYTDNMDKIYRITIRFILEEMIKACQEEMSGF
ncbi:hypothetical protein KUTeg_013004 [Tegillarca granosa]|uniref:Globin domain-containing protein n=1 Tax=Tegillarca granosa TaxID=220873 RepID=A0ABQ9EWZ2_TEGGR|nr:hypothetical protein KUTeg_013001 [Tegillarca granosa]KAJ8308130.1 hypothetical protein KUTeg_013004 [Tegillarca granosa]